MILSTIGVGSATLLFATVASAATLNLNATILTGQNVSVTGALSKGGGSFLIDHPLDPKNRLLYHSFVESPDVLNMYDGIVTLDSRGEAIVRLPDYYDALNKDTQYLVRSIDASAPNLYIKEKEHDNRFTIGGGAAGGEVSWQVTGIRHDPYILAHPIVPEVEKGPNALIGKGQYIFPAGYSGTFSDSYLSFFRRLVYLLGQL